MMTVAPSSTVWVPEWKFRSVAVTVVSAKSACSAAYLGAPGVPAIR
jgi:hypothetical protein